MADNLLSRVDAIAEWVRIDTRRPGKVRDPPPMCGNSVGGENGVGRHQAIDVQLAVEVPDFVLQHSSDQSGALHGDALAVCVQSADTCPVRAGDRELLPRHR